MRHFFLHFRYYYLQISATMASFERSERQSNNVRTDGIRQVSANTEQPTHYDLSVHDSHRTRTTEAERVTPLNNQALRDNHAVYDILDEHEHRERILSENHYLRQQIADLRGQVESLENNYGQLQVAVEDLLDEQAVVIEHITDQYIAERNRRVELDQQALFWQQYSSDQRAQPSILIEEEEIVFNGSRCEFYDFLFFLFIFFQYIPSTLS